MQPVVYKKINQNGYITMASISVSVAADLDDAYQAETTGECLADATNPGNLMGVGSPDYGLRLYSNATASSRRWVAAKFNNITIPKDSTINSATFSGYAFNSNKYDDPDLTFYANAVDNAAAFVHGVTFNITNRALSTANVSWVMMDTGSPKWQTSPDISTVVQEMVNRPGWVSGNALALILKPGVSGNPWIIVGYGGGVGGPPKLDVTYTIPAPPATQRWGMLKQ